MVLVLAPKKFETIWNTAKQHLRNLLEIWCKSKINVPGWLHPSMESVNQGIKANYVYITLYYHALEMNQSRPLIIVLHTSIHYLHVLSVCVGPLGTIFFSPNWSRHICEECCGHRLWLGAGFQEIQHGSHGNTWLHAARGRITWGWKMLGLAL